MHEKYISACMVMSQKRDMIEYKKYINNYPDQEKDKKLQMKEIQMASQGSRKNKVRLCEGRTTI